jgi:ankyrin repeat protein
MEDILQYVSAHCCGVKEVDVTACSNEAVLRAVATRARAALGCPLALDLFVLLRSMGEGGKRCSFSNLGSLLLSDTSSPPLLLFDRGLVPSENALFQAAAHGTAPEVAMLLSLSFAVGDEDHSDEDGSDEDIRTFDVNEKGSQGNSPLLLACKSGNWEMAEMLVVAGAGVSARNYRDDTPLLAAVGAGKLALAEMLVSKGADVNAKDSQGNSPLLLACRSGNWEMAEMLVVAGAGVSAANERRDTPLLAAVGAGKMALAEMLVSKGAHVNVEDSQGNSPLLLACRSGNWEMAEMLVVAGSGVSAEN